MSRDADPERSRADGDAKSRRELDRLSVQARRKRLARGDFEGARGPCATGPMRRSARSVEHYDSKLAAVEERPPSPGRAVQRVGVVGHQDHGGVGVHATEVVHQANAGQLGARAQRVGRRLEERARLRVAVARALDGGAVDAQRNVIEERRGRSRRPGRSRPSSASVNASSAPTSSFGSTPRSRAKWLRVPAGTHTNGSPCAVATDATTASDPSPPAMPSTSAPPAAAPSARVPRSSPGSRTIGSMPRSRAASASRARSALPPPDLGLMKSTGRCGTSARAQL